MNTPHDLGFRMPAEWEPHDATWLAWPHNREDWPGKFHPIRWVYAEIVRHLARVERVRILVNSPAIEKSARRILTKANANLENVEFLPWPTDRVWTRDSGPIFLKHRDTGELAITDWRFNAWAKYNNYKNDDQLPARAAKHLNLRSWQPTISVNVKKGVIPSEERSEESSDLGFRRRVPHPEPQAKGGMDRSPRGPRRAPRSLGWRIVLEGGSIDVNGRGSLLTTEECLLSPIQARNPGVTRDQLETCLRDYLAATNIIWLDRGIAGDDTHGHIDDITRFLSPTRIVTCVEPNTSDPNHAILAENLRRLKRAKLESGNSPDIIELPLPAPVLFAAQRLPASYANFYLANGLCLVPTFNDPHDRVALDILATALPDNTITPIYCGDLVWGLGTLHCATQQQPR